MSVILDAGDFDLWISENLDVNELTDESFFRYAVEFL